MDIVEEIRKLQSERDAVILAHNYQPDEVQDIADFVGDSLELAIKVTEVERSVIVFCGVHFMAETAVILNPAKTVLLPDPEAGCPMADMITGEQLREFKAQYPGALAACYINSTAEVKAECDICVTSANAVEAIRSLPADKPIIFVPDRHLGSYVAEQSGRELILWPGFCPTHARLTGQQVEVARAAYPEALVLVHPESPKPVRDAADAVLSTGGMCRFVRESTARHFIIGTEVGMLYRLRSENPEKFFHSLLDQAVCPNMKKISLEKIRDSLLEMRPVIKVDEGVAARARHAIAAMLALKS